MTLLSGALVAVALVLLAAGLAAQTLTLLYLAIAVSALALLVVAAAAVQRRREVGAAPQPGVPGVAAGARAGQAGRDLDAAAPRPGAPSTAPGGWTDDGAQAPLEDDGLDPVELELGGTVLVVAGRPRYHLDGCSFLQGRQVEEVDVLDAREEGFTPCGQCTPDLVLAELALTEPVDGEPAPAPATPTAPPDRGTSAARAADAAAGGRVGDDVVVAVPDRGSYHRPQCRLVRGVAGAVESTRSVATRQGYDACSSCRP